MTFMMTLLLLVFSLLGIAGWKLAPSVGVGFFVFDIFIFALLARTFHNNSLSLAGVYNAFYYVFIILGSIGFIVSFIMVFRDIVQYMMDKNKRRGKRGDKF